MKNQHISHPPYTPLGQPAGSANAAELGVLKVLWGAQREQIHPSCTRHSDLRSPWDVLHTPSPFWRTDTDPGTTEETIHIHLLRSEISTVT